MRKSRSSGSVGERGGNEPLYPDGIFNLQKFNRKELTGNYLHLEQATLQK